MKQADGRTARPWAFLTQDQGKMDNPWRIELLGGLRLVQDDRVVSRFKSTKNGSLLAYLAYHPEKPQFREALTEMFWPENDIESGRNNFRVALNSLRKQLEPPGVPPGAVLRADRVHVSLNRAAYHTDVEEFEEALRREQQAQSDDERIAALDSAVALYDGELLAGWSEEWIDPERARLSDLHLGALRRLARLLVERKDYDRALEAAHRAVQADPLREQSHANLMRLYLAVGRPAAALQQYRELVRIFKEELGASPSAATRELARQLAEGIQKLPEKHESVVFDTDGGKRGREDAPGAVVGAAASLRVGSLPMQFNRFFGRADELALLQSLLAPPAPDAEPGTTRLITLTGPGGGGKTRLAVEAASRVKHTFGGRVWFVPLAETRDPRLLGDVLAGAMRLPPDPQREPLERVIAAVSAAPSLLVLDNFEQIAEEGADVIMALLQEAPALVCLVTSQLSLGTPGEREVYLAPLPLPEDAHSPEELLEWDSVRLFVDRAQSARPDFQLTSRNSASVGEICRRLEGIPLAIELAASWSQMLSPTQMAERLAERFELLIHPRRPSTERHRTLRAAIEWSYGLLSPQLQRFFSSLFIFSGGWTVEAAQGICDPEGGRVLDLLNQLRARSLVLAEERPTGVRFRMLESLRDFARQQMPDDQALEAAHRHADWYARRAADSARALSGTEAGAWLAVLEDEHDNLRAALEHRFRTEDVEGALTMAGSLWRFWYARGHVAEGRRWLSRVLSEHSETGLPDAACMEAFHGAGRLAAAQGDLVEARVMFGQALSLARSSGLMEQESILLANLALVAREQGDTAVARDASEARLQLIRNTGDRAAIARALETLAGLELRLNEHERAIALLEESLALRRALGDRWNESDTLHSLAEAAGAAGDASRASVTRAEADAVQARVDPASAIAWSFINLGYVAAELGDYPEARGLFEEGLSLLRASGDEQAVALALKCVAVTALAQEDALAVVACAKELFDARRRTGDAAGTSVVLNLLARLAAAHGRSEQAVRIAAAAAAVGRNGDGPPPPSQTSAALLGLDAGSESFVRAWSEGAGLAPDEALAAGLTAVSSPE